ncbi:glycosyltransferase [Allofournierella massiliensis]|uniref:glycosyltransferase n=1 Tax=Allofournierella massiliensis TaxID=1650663 RepID=UPI001FA7D9EA|nr:glycosyltransferase [Fournierella massiliensis]
MLHVVRSMNIGGLENIVKSILLSADRESVICDCLICDEKESDYEEELRTAGINVFKLSAPNKTKIKFYIDLYKFFRNQRQNYDIVHIHMAFTNGLIALAAKRSGVKYIISHSHGVMLPTKNAFIRKPYEVVMRKFMSKYSDGLLACSKSAGDYLFGCEAFREKGKVFLNGIDFLKFAFDENKRDVVRKKLGVEDKLVIGTIGALVPAKNHMQLLRILNEFKQEDNVVGVIIGSGPLKKTLVSYANDHDLRDRLLLLGKRLDVSAYLQAMDVFIFPSISEGFGIALLEAQANGLPCVVSSNIQDEAKIAKNIYTVENDAPLNEWKRAIQKAYNDGRNYYAHDLRESGLDLYSNCKKLFSWYKEFLQ